MSMMQRWMSMLGSQPHNLYNGNDVTFTANTKIDINLPAGTYVFSAEVTTTDTDDTQSLVRFMQEDDQVENARSYIDRSSSGESHTFMVTTTALTHHIYLYCANGWPRSVGDTGTFNNIRIWRIH